MPMRPLSSPLLPGRIRRIRQAPAVFRGASKLTRAPHQLQRRGGPDVGMFKRVSRRFI